MMIGRGGVMAIVASLLQRRVSHNTAAAVALVCANTAAAAAAVTARS